MRQYCDALRLCPQVVLLLLGNEDKANIFCIIALYLRRTIQQLDKAAYCQQTWVKIADDDAQSIQ